MLGYRIDFLRGRFYLTHGPLTPLSNDNRVPIDSLGDAYAIAVEWASQHIPRPGGLDNER